MKKAPPAAVRTYLARIGSKGGSTTGAAKVRDVDYAALSRKAAAARKRNAKARAKISTGKPSLTKSDKTAPVHRSKSAPKKPR